MDVLIFGGMRHAGTQDLRQWLAAMKPAMMDAGCHVYTAAAMAGLVHGRPEAITGRIAELVDTARRGGAKRVIFEHSRFSGLGAPEMDALRRGMAGARTHFVLTLRHWNTFLPVIWGLNSIHVDAMSFPAMLRRLLDPASQSPLIRFDLVARRVLDAGFDQVSVVSQDNAKAGRGLLAEMLALAELPDMERIALAATKEEPTDRHWPTIDMVRIANGARSLFERRDPNPRFGALETQGINTRVPDYDHPAGAVAATFNAFFPEVSALLKQVETTVLRGADFARFHERLDAVVRGHLVNPAPNGSVWGDVVDVAVRSSALESEDLPPLLCGMIAVALQNARAFQDGSVPKMGHRRH